MGLAEFFKEAGQAGRRKLVAETGTTEAYLRRLCTQGKCSVSMAYAIHVASKQIAKGNPKLSAIDGESLVRDPSKYRSFVKKVRQAAEEAHA